MTIDPRRVPSLPGGPLDARVTRIVDGDTVEIIAALPIGEVLPGTGCCSPVAFVSWRVRLAGIDAPEIHPSASSPLRALEKTAGEKVKAHLSGLLTNQRVTVTFDKWDKFGGRVIGHLVHQGVDVSQALLNLRYVRHYSGERKTPWPEELLNRIISET